MKNEQYTRIDRAIDIFLDALNEGTLAKGSCAACAVGNLVASGLEGKITSTSGEFKCDKLNNAWSFLFFTAGDEQRFSKSNLDYPNVLMNIQATEFTLEELMQIEFAFETNTLIPYYVYSRHTAEEIRADQIKGLEAVVKVMLTFDEDKRDAVQIFTKKAKLIPC